MERLENELWRRWSDGKVGEWALLFPTLPSIYLRHRLFSNPSFASPTSQLILQPFFRFSYVTRSSLNSPGEPPMLCCQIDDPATMLSYLGTRKKSLGARSGYKADAARTQNHMPLVYERQLEMNDLMHWQVGDECPWRAYRGVYFFEQIATWLADYCSMCQWWFLPL